VTLTLAPVVEAPVEPTTPPKLSELLRLGAMTTEQGFNALYFKMHDTYCAVGTIYHASGWDGSRQEFVANPLFALSRPNTWTPSENLNIALAQKTAYCADHVALGLPLTAQFLQPDGTYREGPYLPSVLDLIVHLNDTHKMPRNQIADALEARGL